MMKHKKDRLCIVGIGETLWDMMPTGKQPGGAPSNFVFHAHSLGADGYPASSVGNDALGHEIMNTIPDLNLDDTYSSTLVWN